MPILEMPRQSTVTVVVEAATKSPVEAAPVVVEPVVVGPVVVAAPVVVKPVVPAPSEDKINWAEELFMVRNIFTVRKRARLWTVSSIATVTCWWWGML